MLRVTISGSWFTMTDRATLVVSAQATFSPVQLLHDPYPNLLS
jgi:hypothetical protein